MSDFSPVVLFFIVKESLAELFWPSAIIGLLLLVGVLIAALRAHGRGQLCRALTYAVGILFVVAAGMVPVVPLWSGVEMTAFSNWLDVMFAFVVALVPAAIVAATVFIGTGLRRRNH